MARRCNLATQQLSVRVTTISNLFPAEFQPERNSSNLIELGSIFINIGSIVNVFTLSVQAEGNVTWLIMFHLCDSTVLRNNFML